MGYIDLPVSGGGITIYPNLAAFPASAPDGTQGVAADTNTIYIYNSSVPGWVAVATPPVGVYISDLTGDVTATGPGSAAATVAFVGGETAADVATSVQDTQAATDLSTVSTIVKRDASGQTSLDGLNLDGSTSGAISIQAANTTTSYTVKMPNAQGAASTYLQNDGSGNLSWASVSALPSQTGNVDKVLATDGTSSSWQFAGLGAGSLGTNNIVIGKAKPTALTTGVRDIVIGTGTAFDAVTTASDSIAIGHNVVVNNASQSVVIGSGSSAPNNNGDSVTVGYNAVGGWYSVVIGSGASTFTGNDGGMVTIGGGASSSAYSTAIGGFSSASGNSSVAIGRGAVSSGTGSIALGFASSTDSIAGALAIGSLNYPISIAYLGRGAADQTTANAVKLMTMKASGTDTDLSVGTLTLAGSQSTGNKAGGDVIISTAPAGSSGSSLNSHVERIRAKAATEVVVNDTGVDFDFRVEGDTDANLLFVDAGADRVGVGTATPATKLDVSGTAQATAMQVPNYILSPQLYDEGTETGNFTLNLANGPAQQVTINAAGPLTITLSNPVTGGAYLIKIIQGATPGTVTWPANVLWGAAGAPTLSLATGDIDIINLFYDGTDYYGTYALGF